MRLISPLSASKYGRVRFSSFFAFRSFVEEIRYMALVIFCVSLMLAIRLLISFALGMDYSFLKRSAFAARYSSAMRRISCFISSVSTFSSSSERQRSECSCSK